MKKLIVLCAVALMALFLVLSVVGCREQPAAEPAGPSVTIMVESSIVEAGSSFIVSGLNFKPGQKIWVDFKWRASDRSEGVTAYCEADENGSIHPVIDVPEDTVPGDYEVEVFTGNNVHDRKLLATLPIRIQARANVFTVVLELSVQKATLEEADSIIGIAVPVPTYLTEGYEIREIYLQPMMSGPPGVIILISDRETEKKLVTHTDAAGTRQQYELRCRITMRIRWDSDGHLIPPAKAPVPKRGVKINASDGLIMVEDDTNDLWWTWRPDPDDEGLFELEISANKDIPEEELVRVAESVEQ